MPSEDRPSAVNQEDVADIMNKINDALDDTEYVAVGYDNIDTFLRIIIDRQKIGVIDDSEKIYRDFIMAADRMRDALCEAAKMLKDRIEMIKNASLVNREFIMKSLAEIDEVTGEPMYTVHSYFTKTDQPEKEP